MASALTTFMALVACAGLCYFGVTLAIGYRKSHLWVCALSLGLISLVIGVLSGICVIRGVTG